MPIFMKWICQSAMKCHDRVLHGTGNSSNEDSDVPYVARAETPAGYGE